MLRVQIVLTLSPDTAGWLAARLAARLLLSLLAAPFSLSSSSLLLCAWEIVLPSARHHQVCSPQNKVRLFLGDSNPQAALYLEEHPPRHKQMWGG